MYHLKRCILLVLIIAFASCKKEDTSVQKKNSPIDSIQDPNQKTIRAIGEILTPEAKKKVENWKEYHQLDDFLDNFYSSSPNETLNLSKELSVTTQQLKDSIQIDRFKQPDVSIRINVIHNYALRLADMATIPSIQPTEVQEETQNILDAFSALNSKINNITKQEQIEEELKGFDAPITLKTSDTLTQPERLVE